MTSRHLRGAMWGEALSLLEQAERLQRQFFRMGQAASNYAWEPPADVIETPDGLRIQVALPGVAAEAVAVDLSGNGVTVSALRPFPECGSGARLHRVEIPYGRFERRIALQAQTLELIGHTLKDGLLTLTFAKRAR